MGSLCVKEGGVGWCEVDVGDFECICFLVMYVGWEGYLYVLESEWDVCFVSVLGIVVSVWKKKKR